jgi:hypothetical protein
MGLIFSYDSDDDIWYALIENSDVSFPFSLTGYSNGVNILGEFQAAMQQGEAALIDILPNQLTLPADITGVDAFGMLFEETTTSEVVGVAAAIEPFGAGVVLSSALDELATWLTDALAIIIGA